MDLNPEDFVTPEAKMAAKMDEASGVNGGAQQGMAPYPLYGIPGMGQETEVSIPFYRRPWFCYSVGAGVGFGAAYLFFEWFKPKYMKKNPRRKKKSED